MIAKIPLRANVIRFLIRKYSENVSKGPTSSGTASVPSAPNVPGLSSKCVEPAAQPVGPGVDPNKSGAYKVPEYFCYNNMSYFEAEIEMSKFRLPQPSAVKK